MRLSILDLLAAAGSAVAVIGAIFTVFGQSLIVKILNGRYVKSEVQQVQIKEIEHVFEAGIEKIEQKIDLTYRELSTRLDALERSVERIRDSHRQG